MVDYPDARRMDLRQTLRDPYQQIQVKLFNQDNTTPIFAVCDLSSSMQFNKIRRKLDKVMEISASIAYTASIAGDLFSLIGYHRQVIEEFTLPLSYQLNQSFETIAKLEHYRQMGVGSDGILEVPQYLSQNKGLVFWISDFHTDLKRIEQALNAMSRHQVVPIVLWDEQEYEKIPKFGFGTMIDPETGLNRTIFFRDSIRTKFIDAFEARKKALENIFMKFDSPAIFMGAEYKPETMSNYFEQYMSL